MIQTLVTMRVWCDERGCDLSTETDNDGGLWELTKTAARDVAASEGWGRRGRRDFCPAHRPDALVNALADVDLQSTDQELRP